MLSKMGSCGDTSRAAPSWPSRSWKVTDCINLAGVAEGRLSEEQALFAARRLLVDIAWEFYHLDRPHQARGGNTV